MKKTLVLVGVIAALALLAVSQRAGIATRLLERGLEARLGSDVIDSFPDGLHVALCGAGGPLPAPRASGPCVAVVAGRQLFMVDSGTDGVRNLGRMGYQTGNIAGVFLTHFHSDHIDGLGEVATLRWAGGGNKAPLPVYGPPGVERVVQGFNDAYAQDVVYRHAHHGNLVADPSGAGLSARPFAHPAPGELTTVFTGGGLTVEALRVEHSPVDPAVGYRFTYKGRTALITGDTSQSDNITRFAQGVDLLVHEALAPNLVNMMHDAAVKNGNEVMAKVTHDILDYHASPVEAAETARDAGVGHLLYYHIVPPLIIPGQKTLFLNGAQDIFPDYTIGEDGVTFALPANSREITLSRKGL
ncbi:MAG: MBL fold metallo-hydrolase [Halioglobus sp.]